MWTRTGIAWIVTSCWLVATVGCGGRQPQGPKLVPAAGSVQLDGKAAPGVMVTFIPTGPTRGEGAVGMTDSSGKYELKVRGVQSGVPAGEYRVTCQKLVMPDGSDFDPKKQVSMIDSGARQILPLIYSDAEKTTLKATVPAEGGKFDFDLKSSR